MKKLIALRPIFYRGRTYQRGDAVPANDDVMTAAWLKAGSAEWEAEKREEPPAPPSGEQLRLEAEHKACIVLEGLGVAVTDDAGRFVGEEYLTEQLRALGASLAPEREDAPAPAPVPETPAEEEIPEEAEDAAKDEAPAGKKGKKK